MPLILPANTLSTDAYAVANSCHFEAGDSAAMNITIGSDGDKTEWTFSAWIKLVASTATVVIFNGYVSGDNETRIFISSRKLQYYNYVSSAADGEYATSRLLRDPSAWYHIVVAIDNDEGTAGDRIRFYINGVEETYFGTETAPSSGSVTFVNDDNAHYLGRSGSGQYFDGYMAEVCFIDGQQLAASSFGEFDSDSPTMWKAKDVSGLTFGSNGFYLDFEDSDNLGDDESGNGNDLAEVNIAATDQKIDTPTNNFCVLNTNWSTKGGTPGAGTFSKGNLKFVGDGDHDCTFGTIGLQNGLWYWEVLLSNDAGAGIQIGATTTEAMQDITSGDSGTCYPTFVGFRNEVETINWNVVSVSDYGANATNDIYGLLLDLDSGTKTLKCYHNDTLKDTINLPTDKGDTWIPYIGDTGSADAEMEANFGNPPYAISSGNADPSGYGDFEFATKSGYAICTKNLAEQG